MSDPNETGRNVSVTLKAGKDYDQPWIVFHGSVEAVREDIIQAFGWEGTETAELNLHELTTQASGTFRATGTVVKTFPNAKIDKKASDEASKGKSSGAWSAARKSEPGAPAEPERNPIYDLFDSATTLDEVKGIWAKHRAEIEPDKNGLYAAMVKRRDEVKAAA